MIDRATTEYLEAGLAIHIGTRNARLEPDGCRVTAVRVENQGREVVAFVPAAATSAVLQNLRDNGQAALSFARPVDERAMQVKGVFVDVRDADPSEERFVMAQWEGFLRQLDTVGIPGRSTATWKLWPCNAVRIRVTALFSSTPGPDAGAVLT
jgi:hypothetical protein